MTERGEDEKSCTVRVKNCWGIASLRQCSGFPTSTFSTLQKRAKDNLCYDCPLGCCIVRWNVVKGKRVVFFQANEDLVSVLCKSSFDDVVLSVSYSGKGTLWTEKYEKIDSFCFPSNYVIYGTWSNHNNRFGVCSKGPNAKLGIYEVIHDSSGSTKVKMISVILCPQQRSYHSEDSQDKKYSCYDNCLFTPSSEIIAVCQTYEAPCELHLFNSNGEFLKKCAISPLGDPETVMLCTSQDRNGEFAIGLQGGLFQYIKCSDINRKDFFQAIGSPQVCIWDGSTLLTVAYLSGKMLWWSRECEIKRELDGAPGGSIIKLSWEEEGKYLWVGGLMSLNYVEIPTAGADVDVKYSLEKHQLSGCGISVNSALETASGDLSGNVFIWKDTMEDYQHHFNVSEMVRCVVWCERSVIIGTLDGNVFLLHLDTPDNTPIFMEPPSPTLVFSIKGGVLCFDINIYDKILVFGATSGHVFVLSYDEHSQFLKLNEFLVHTSKHGKEMEVWSICFSPDSSMLATGSEDYTCIIIDRKSGKVIKTLSGHTMAVTSVDWKQMVDATPCLATCSDDRTVRVYNGNDFALRFVLNTYDIYGWHTLTYLKINPFNGSLACSTQNGYVVIWDIATRQRLLKRRVHNGSVEGLCWSPNYEFLATVGSDGVVNNLSVHYNEAAITS